MVVGTWDEVGAWVAGDLVGNDVLGLFIGASDGIMVGFTVCFAVGFAVCCITGLSVGLNVGLIVLGVGSYSISEGQTCKVRFMHDCKRICKDLLFVNPRGTFHISI